MTKKKLVQLLITADTEKEKDYIKECIRGKEFKRYTWNVMVDIPRYLDIEEEFFDE